MGMEVQVVLSNMLEVYLELFGDLLSTRFFVWIFA